MARASVTFQVLEGIDRGRIYREVAIPVSIGREEGNALRLNDERVSRFHAKVQLDGDDYILTDLESTNGTRVNGTSCRFAGCASATASASAARCSCSAPTRKSPTAWPVSPASARLPMH